MKESYFDRGTLKILAYIILHKLLSVIHSKKKADQQHHPSIFAISSTNKGGIFLFGTTIVFQFLVWRRKFISPQTILQRQRNVHFFFLLPAGTPNHSIFVKERVTYVNPFLFMFSDVYPSDRLAQTFPIAERFRQGGKS